MESQSISEMDSESEENHQSLIEKQVGNGEMIESFFTLSENNQKLFQDLGKYFFLSNKS